MRQRLIMPLVAVAAGLSLALVGCSSSDSDDQQASVPSPAATTTAVTTPTGARQLLAKDFAEAVKQPGTVIIDVRTAAEFAEGHLAGAKNIDVESSEFTKQIALLDKSASYAVYCRSGSRSVAASKIMAAAGLTKVVNLYGGITAWTAAGNQVTTS